MNHQPLSLSRRQFVITASTVTGGMALGLIIPGQARAATPEIGTQYWGADGVNPNEVNAWVVINPDDSVILRCSMAEMGQGTGTGFVQLLAEELECDWSKVKCEFASVNRNIREKEVYKDMRTVGSRGIRTTWEFVQQAGASARARLVAAAAKRWNVPDNQCEAAMSVVTHKPTGRKLRFGEIAKDAAKIVLEKEPGLKMPESFKLAGKPLPRLDTRVKVDGSAMFGSDTRLPGMLYASIISCPVFKGKLVSVDESAIAGRRGIVKVVKLDNAVAVVADNFWRANEALKLLKIVWDGGAAAKTDSDQFRKDYIAALDAPMNVARNDGDAKGVIAKGGKVMEALYQAPYLAHATMEPCNATVHLQKDRLEVWMGSQAALENAHQAAEVAGLEPEQVYFHNCFLGGGFGRRTDGDELRHAVLVAKTGGIDKPLQLLWTREEDMRNDRYRPMAAVRLKAALTPDGKIDAMYSENVVGSIFGSNGMAARMVNGIDPPSVEGLSASVPYNKIANWYSGVNLKDTHVPVSFWRSVGGSQNTFFLESFIDELAHAAGKDPIEFRRSLTDRVDSLSVINKLAEVSNWNEKLPPGKGRGIAIADNHGALVGHVAEVTVSDNGQLKVDRVIAALDAYHIVNPNLVAAQCEGGIIFGLTAMLHGEITIKDGAVEQSNFDRYEMLKLVDSPKIEVHFALTGGTDPNGKPKWGGVGECSVAPLAGAVANAIFSATGKRIRSLPFKNVKLSELAKL